MILVAQTEIKWTTLTKDKVSSDACYKSIFEGVGRYKKLVTVREKVGPLQVPLGKVPIAMKDTFEAGIHVIESQGIISRLNNDTAPQWLTGVATVTGAQ